MTGLAFREISRPGNLIQSSAATQRISPATVAIAIKTANTVVTASSKSSSDNRPLRGCDMAQSLDLLCGLLTTEPATKNNFLVSGGNAALTQSRWRMRKGKFEKISSVP